MTQSARHYRRYAKFESRVLSLVHSYWRVHDDQKLRTAASILRDLSLRTGDSQMSSVQVTVVLGWISRRGGYRLDVAALRRLNPGYRVRVRRLIRSDVVLSKRLHGIRLGFRVVARGPIDLAPFTFGIAGIGGGIVALPASNSDAEFKLAHLGNISTQDASASHLELADRPVGYVDKVILSTGLDNRTGNAWLSTLAHRNPREIFEIVESPYGRFAAAMVARLFETFPANARWSDRFALSAFGERATFASDLSPLFVARPYDELPPNNLKTAMPVLSRHGNIVESLPGGYKAPAPSDKWLRYENALVQDGGTLIVDRQLIVYEDAADPKRDFISGQWETIFGSRVNQEVALVHLRTQANAEVDEGILLSGRNDSNWYHWLIEYLPRVLRIDPGVSDEVPVIVSSRTARAGIDALRSLTSRRVIVLNPSVAYKVKVLHVVAPPVQILDTTRVPWERGLSFNPVPLLAMRKAWGPNRLELVTTRRVFLRRNSGHRGLLNETSIARIAAGYGLEIVDPGAMSWEEQRALFSSAELLVGASGAVMANYLMMPAGSHILALTSDALADFVLPAAIASVAGAHFRYVLGQPSTRLTDSERRSGWIHSNFSVRENDFEAALLRVFKEIAHAPAIANSSERSNRRVVAVSGDRAHAVE